MAETSGPNDYAPLSRRLAEKSSIRDGLNAVEGDIRQLVRREGPLADPRRTELEISNNPAAENLSTHVQRVAGTSMEEVDRVIRELESVRELLKNEGQRVSREIASYASLSHAASTAMRVIAESVKQWKEGTDGSTPPNSNFHQR